MAEQKLVGGASLAIFIVMILLFLMFFIFWVDPVTRACLLDATKCA